MFDENQDMLTALFVAHVAALLFRAHLCAAQHSTAQQPTGSVSMADGLLKVKERHRVR